MPYTLRLFITEEDGTIAAPWIVYYDPEYHWPDGYFDGGFLVTDGDELQARTFDTPAAALKYWRSGPTCECHRLRPDGKPNRPLTAFCCEIAWIDE